MEIGTTVHVHSHVHQIGRTMAFIRGFMTSEDGSIVYTTCEHHKVYVPTRQPISDFPIPWDDQWKTVATKGEEKEEKDKAKL